MRTGKTSEGEPLPADWEPEERREDPPIASQFLPYLDRNFSERYDAYMRACQVAPGASEGTKRKWMKRLGI